MPFTLNFLENTYDSVKLTENTQIKYNLEKANTNTAKQNYPGSVALRLGCSSNFLLATKLRHKKPRRGSRGVNLLEGENHPQLEERTIKYTEK